MNGLSLNFNQTKTLIKECGRHITVLVEGEPGIGKSALLAQLAREMPEYHPVYLEAQTLDLGDIQMPRVSERSVSFVPNEAFLPPADNPNAPILLMIDEIGKAMRPVQNALLRVIHERKLGSYALPLNSIVFATTNLTTDGVGDAIQAHAIGRMTQVHMGKATADEMVEYGANNGYAPEMLAWIKHTPHCMNSYTDDPDNIYAFNPKKHQRAYFSPRQAEKAGHILAKRGSFTPDTLISALAGTIGESAARDMQAFLTVGDALPEWKRVVEHPDTCPVPTDPIAQQMLALSAVARMDKANMDGWLTYMERLMPEVKALFATNALRGSKAGMLATNRKFTEYAVANSWCY